MRLPLYVAGEIARKSALALGVLFAIYFAIDLTELGNAEGAALGPALAAYFLRVPAALGFLLPASLGIGAALGLCGLRLRGEWVAVQASGCNARALCAFMLAPALLGFFIALPLDTTIAPRALGAWQEAAGRVYATRGTIRGSAGNWTRARGIGFARFAAGSGDADLWAHTRSAWPDTWCMRTKTETWQCWTRTSGWLTRTAPLGLEDLSAVTTNRATRAELPDEALGHRALSDRAAALRALGLSPAGAESERALRLNLSWACLLVPAFALGLAILAPRAGVVQHAALGLFAAALYWLFTAAAWNGAVMGQWSAGWLSVGAPFCFGVVATGVWTAAYFTRRW